MVIDPMATATETDLCAFTINLTRDHLDSSVERNCRLCAVALAVEAAVGSHRFVGVSIDGRIYVKAHSAGRHVEAVVDEPERVAAIVRRVDAGEGDEVEATTFRIHCPFEPLREL